MECECHSCKRCGGSGMEHWYLGDEFNSNGYSTCDSCEGTGMIYEDCPLHGPDSEPPTSEQLMESTSEPGEA